MRPWLYVSALAAALAGLGWLSYTATGTGSFSGERCKYEYTYHRFELGDHVLEIHVGERVA